ncbi:hypothetical protein EC991_003516 [Linnemannia zychae]|nr:hypothetical protein EC991_003516 [Linnemannia zychae]
MRLSAVAIAASLVAVANAQSAYFPFPPEGACVAACTDRVGKSRFPEFNDVDEYGPRFIESLSYTFESGSPNTVQFMMEAGSCMGPCPTPELDLYRQQFSAKKAWYTANKNGTPPPRPVTTTTTTTVAPATTTTEPPTTTTTPPVIDPAFPFLPNGPCVAKCTLEAGKSLYPDYSEDPKSPFFWESMSYSYVRGSTKNQAFMIKAGTCMAPCPKPEITLYTSQYSAQVNWYNANKPTTTAPPTTTTTTTTTTAPPTTTTLPPGVDPAYPFLPNGPCVSNCINTVGKSKFPNFSEDPKSPYFFESLSYTFDRGSPKTRDFMAEVGMCQGKCPAAENQLYSSQYAAQAAWYDANKPKVTTTSAPVTTTTTTTSGPVPTGPVNPPGDYPFKPNGACVSSCTNKVGKSMFPNYSEDPKSPYFIQSLAYTFESGSANTQQFMIEAGTCMGPCPAAELDLYRAQYAAQKAWYNAHKNGGGNPPTSTTAPVTTTTSGPVPTGPVKPPGDYPFKPNGACVSSCTNKVGKSMFPNYSEDPKSPYFIQSLAYTFESGSANTQQFMIEAGTCMGPCPAAELDLYRAQYAAQKAWYNANKNGGGVNPPASTTTTSGPVPTGPVNPPTGGFDYPFKPNGACVAGCTNKVGKAMFPNYSEDPKSPYFIQSLAYTFESGSANTLKFMSDAGSCMGPCPVAELDLYRAQYAAQKEWYNANKNGGGNPTDPTTPVNPTNPTDPTAPPTGPVTPPTGGFVYPFEPNGPCVSGCTIKAGKALLPEYSEDPTSPYFIQSLGFSFESGSPNTQKFMIDAGTCMGACPQAELDLYLKQFPDQKAWYLANKNAVINGTTPSVPTPTGGPSPGAGNNGNGAVKFAASGLATLLAVISAVVIAI